MNIQRQINHNLPSFAGLNKNIKWGFECSELNTSSSIDSIAIPILYYETYWKSPSAILASNNISELEGIGQFKIWLNQPSIVPKIHEFMQKRQHIDVKILQYANIEGKHQRIGTWSITKCVIVEYWFQSQISHEDLDELHGIEIKSNGTIQYSVVKIENNITKGVIASPTWDIKRGNLS